MSSILVSGDVIIDHHIYKGERDAPHIKNVPGTKVIKSKGGAILLYNILRNIADHTKKLNSKAKTRNKETSLIEYTVQLGLKEISYHSLSADHNAYAVWTPCLKVKDSKDKRRVWRMTESMGYGGDTVARDVCQSLPAAMDKINPDILVIDDGALGFRFCKDDAWSNFLNAPSSNNLKWVVLKTSSPVAQGDLWRTLSSNYMNKLVILVSVQDIRREEAGITHGLSWERTALDLLTELKFNASITDLLKCRHLIVSFGSEGALWISRESEPKPLNRLIYDPAYLEGEWANNYDGKVFGHLSCLTAGIVSSLVRLQTEKDIGNGIIAGLSAMRALHQAGHGFVKEKKPGFPFAEVAKALQRPKIEPYCIIQAPAIPEKIDSQPVHWEIIEGIRTSSKAAATPLYSYARRIALFGAKALSSIPYISFRKLFTVDRSEMESLRGIERLMKSYKTNPKAPRPLSIAVFGPPGSGKSFGIKQIAGAIIGQGASILEFNLSQFEKPEDLIGPLHQVRDEVLNGKVPVVSWDEFDSIDNFWLQYLLAPMQDGKFREGMMSHPIGKSVFVFAGGTSRTMENFTPDESDAEVYQNFVKKKGPDFVSRLSGYLNVLGPNRRQKFDKENKKWVDDDIHIDICFPVRRALLLRNMIGLGKDEELGIDKGLLNAFLEIEEYSHGARSLETLVMLIKGQKTGGLMRSDLPPEEQMSIHVDYQKFVNIVKRDLPFKMHAEKLAPYIHRFYKKLCEDNKWDFKYKMEYDDLPPDIKSDNIAAAARLPEVLYLAGLKIIPKDYPDSLSDEEIRTAIEEGIEILAEEEHDGWMEYKIQNGWSLGDRSDEKKTHNLLMPFRKLSEKERNKDYDAVRHYPDIVKLAGFKICGIK
jgi:hypothetical protein